MPPDGAEAGVAGHGDKDVFYSRNPWLFSQDTKAW